MNNELVLVGKYLEGIAKKKSLSLRDLTKITGLSINSIKVVFAGSLGTIKTYEQVCTALGTTFCRAVADTMNSQVSPAKTMETVAATSITNAEKE